MRTQKQLYPQISNVYKCELKTCLICGSRLEQSDYLNGRKIVQTVPSVMQVGYYPKWCPIPECVGYQSRLRSAEWQQIALLHGTYGYDVIASIGWQRQTLHQTFAEVHSELAKKVQISESQVRYLYSCQYLPLLACHERESWPELEQVSAEIGLILTLDGLAPAGGEPQLWLVRELRTGKTLRSGWMSEQGQTAFENFLRPIVEAGLRVEAVMSDKQRGLVPAIEVILPKFKSDYLDLSQGADWLHHISELLNPDGKPARTGEQVQAALLSYLDDIQRQSQNNEVLAEFATQIKKTAHSYLKGLFHSYDIPDLPRTNNDRESEFRRLNQHLLRTTGQKGGTRRLIQRSGAWKLIPRPDSLTETVVAISTVEHGEYEKERTRVRSHRDRFRFHTRSVKRSRKQLQDLKERWLQLPPDKSPETSHFQGERVPP